MLFPQSHVALPRQHKHKSINADLFIFHSGNPIAMINITSTSRLDYIMSLPHGQHRHTHRHTSTLQPNHSALDKGKKAATGRLRKSQFQTPQVPKRVTLKYVTTTYSTAYGKSITSLNLKTETWQVWCRNNQEQRFSLDYSGPLEF